MNKSSYEQWDGEVYIGNYKFDLSKTFRGMSMRYTTVFIIRELSTGKLIKFGSKCGWSTIGAAKNAFALHMHTTYRDYFVDGKGLFDSQNDFVIEEFK